MQRAVDFEKAVAAYKGFSGLARALNEPLSTVHGWARRKRLPPWRAKQIAEMARADKKNIWVKSKKRGARGKQVT